ncbi:MAG: hypothetical protein KDA24_02770 [Deltaproteobacteria bacterium]|nr:hypothetical protein [Deltaproteobacteria bacterium]
MRKYGVAAALALLIVLGLAGCPKGSASRSISGQISVTRDGQSQPISEAQVRVWPKDPSKKAEPFEYEAVQNLRGVTLTRGSGQFEVGSLTSAETHAEYPILKGWTYVVEVEVAGYYITQAEFAYTGGQAWVEVAIEEKPMDVLDTSGGVKDNEKKLERGAVRKE